MLGGAAGQGFGTGQQQGGGAGADQMDSMHTPSPLGDIGGLDEPVWDTMMRDLRRIGVKIKHVVFPQNNSEDMQKQLRDCESAVPRGCPRACCR